MRYPAVVRRGFPCTIKECPPGHFFYKEQLCFKSEYYQDDMVAPMVFCSSGEFLSREHHDEIIEPADIVWVDIDREEIAFLLDTVKDTYK